MRQVHTGGDRSYSRRRISELTGLEAFINLDSLTITLNPLKGIDLSSNTALRYLECTSLNLSANTGLTEVCVWTLPFPPQGVVVLQAYSPNIEFITTCSR